MHTASKQPAFGASPTGDHEIDRTQGSWSLDIMVGSKHSENKSCLSITPIGKGGPFWIVMRHLGPKGSVAGFKIVTRWPEATAMRFSSDQAMALGYDGAPTRTAAWKRDFELSVWIWDPQFGLH